MVRGWPLRSVTRCPRGRQVQRSVIGERDGGHLQELHHVVVATGAGVVPRRQGAPSGELAQVRGDPCGVGQRGPGGGLAGAGGEQLVDGVVEREAPPPAATLGPAALGRAAAAGPRRCLAGRSRGRPRARSRRGRSTRSAASGPIRRLGSPRPLAGPSSRATVQLRAPVAGEPRSTFSLPPPAAAKRSSRGIHVPQRRVHLRWCVVRFRVRSGSRRTRPGRRRRCRCALPARRRSGADRPVSSPGLPWSW